MEDEGLRSACVAVGWNWWWLQDVEADGWDEEELVVAAGCGSWWDLVIFRERLMNLGINKCFGLECEDAGGL